VRRSEGGGRRAALCVTCKKKGACSGAKETHKYYKGKFYLVPISQFPYLKGRGGKTCFSISTNIIAEPFMVYYIQSNIKASAKFFVMELYKR
jgi:hypothetical protein